MEPEKVILEIGLVIIVAIVIWGLYFKKD